MTMKRLTRFVAASLLLRLALSQDTVVIGPSADLYIVSKNISPDGFGRSATLAGASADTASFPGPLIRGIKGSTFELNVIDRLSDPGMLRSTSIHWHGILQEGTPWADGAASVTQCPIAPEESFLYQFKVPNQAGTFWYHSHYSTQYCDGLRGVFVVDDPQDPHRERYLIDDESTIITLADWYHATYHGGVPPTPQATLINGKGRYVGGPRTDLAVIRVAEGVKYRFRLVSIACEPNYVFSIDGHNMMVIEADGVNTEPVTVDSIQVFAGQRYSFVLDANQPIGNYWIRAQPNRGNTQFEGGINSAILRYVTAPAEEPTTTQTPSTNPLLETSLAPLENPGAPGGNAPADIAINLKVGFDLNKFMFTINGVAFQPPTSPVLLQILSGAVRPEDLLPKGSIYELPRNKVIEISIPGGSLETGSPHPFYLHGHTFDVVRSAGSSTYNYENPVRRDVVNTGVTGDNVTIRFRTDNPGPWFLHCHMNFHLELGLAVVFTEDVPSTQNMQPPKSWDRLCPIYDSIAQEFH